MDRLSISEMTTYRWSFDEDVQNYKSAGVGSIGVWRQKLSDFGDEKGSELLRDSGLSVSSLGWAGGFTGSEGRSHRESIEDAKEAIQLANSLRAECLILYTGARAGHTHNHARRLIKSALAEITPLAAELNVTLALKPMHAGCSAEWTFLTDLDDAIGLIDSVGSPSLKMAFDTYHFGYDDDILDRLPELTGRLAIVQLGDARRQPQGEQDRCPLGQGIIPLRDIVVTLNDAGYTGYYEVELMGEEIEASDYHELISDSKRQFQEFMSVSRAS